MELLKFSASIIAPKQKVWDILWNNTTYPLWTAAFCEGSYAVSDWNKGSKIQFLSPNGGGMYGIIDKKVPGEIMTFRHLGEIKNGTEEPKDWPGATETYNLSERNGITIVDVEMNATGDFKSYLEKTFPKALQLLKEICEK